MSRTVPKIEERAICYIQCQMNYTFVIFVKSFKAEKLQFLLSVLELINNLNNLK
jgi:hypothetical protein